MQISIQFLIDRVNESKILSLKTVLSRILGKLADPDSSIMEIKNLIELDPPLAANILKRANSAYFGSKRRIYTVIDAVMNLGLDAVKEMILQQKVFELFGKGKVCFGYSQKLLWLHSVAIATCCKHLYRKELCRKGDDIYTAGLLHDIGIIVEDQFAGEAFATILETAARKGVNLHEAEAELLGWCHEDIGGSLAESWNLPEELAGVLRCAERPWLAVDEGVKMMAQILFIAHCACQQRQLGYSEMPAGDNSKYQACLKDLNIKERALDFILDEVVRELMLMEENGWW